MPSGHLRPPDVLAAPLCTPQVRHRLARAAPTQGAQSVWDVGMVKERVWGVGMVKGRVWGIGMDTERVWGVGVVKGRVLGVAQVRHRLSRAAPTQGKPQTPDPDHTT